MAAESPEDSATGFTEVLERAARAEERARILGEQLAVAQAVPPAPAAPAEVPLTPEQLQVAVDEGRLTVDAAAEYTRNKERAALREDVKRDLASDDAAERIRSEVAAYKAARPGLNETGSEDWKAANEEYVHLTDVLGMPHNDATQVAACRNVFGPARFLGEAPEERRQSHQEAGGAGRGPRGESTGDKDIPAKIKNDKNRLAHYTNMIEKGLYPGGWTDKDIAKEVKYMD